MQMTINQLLAPDFNPLPRGDRHYVPVVQNRKGELDALRRSLVTNHDFTPLVAVVGPKPAATPRMFSGGATNSWIRKIGDATESRPFYLDTARLDPMHPVDMRIRMPVLERLFSVARNRGLQAIPVGRVGNDAQLDLIAAAAVEDGRGIAIRFPVRHLATPPGMGLIDLALNTLTRTGFDAGWVDLIIDLDYLDEDTEINPRLFSKQLRGLGSSANWRNIILIGTSMPSSLSCVREQSIGRIERREWSLWRDLVATSDVSVTFGDYVVQHPSPPHDKGGPGMRANIRYTDRHNTVIARGLAVMEEGKEQYADLCAALVDHPSFRGSQFSWGDATIANCAAGIIEPGSQSMWRGAGTSHHIELVCSQLRELPAG